MTNIGQIMLHGDPTQGKITAVENTALGRKVVFGEPSRLLFVVRDGAGQDETLPFSALSSVGITATLTPRAGARDEFLHLTLHMEVPETVTVRDIRFELPSFNVGGEDTLMFPYEAGFRYKNPARALYSPLDVREFAWKDRRASVAVGGMLPPCDSDIPERSYETTAAVQFIDYYSDHGFGLYLGAHDPGFETTLFAFSAKRGDDRIDLTMTKRFNRHLASWECDFVLGLHPGDWHAASDYYRPFFESTGLKIRHCQDAAAGMSCHYDLLWQNGDINHRYSDLPEVARIAREEGFDTILCAGWHNGGFDTNYPDFRPDPKLGTEEEFIAAVNKLHEEGSKIFVYINAFSYDRDSDGFDEFGLPAAIKLDDGSTRDVPWGSRVLTGMCMAADWWREKVLDNVRYATQVIGVDGVYLDQLNLQRPPCTDPHHNHDRSQILQNLRLAQEARRRFGDKVVLLSEWVLDAMASELDIQLLQTIWRSLEYAYPEFFRYTFPTAGVVDMILQKPWAGYDPSIEGEFVRDVFDRLFVTGIRFWCYDHVAGTSGFEDYFKRGMALRQQYNAEFLEGIYLDDTELAPVSAGVTASTFALGERRMLTAANRTGLPQTIRFRDGREVEIPADELSVTMVEPAK